MSQEDNKVDTTIDEKQLEALKAKATTLGIQFNQKIGIAKLQEKIDAHIAAVDASSNEVKTAGTNTSSVGPNKKILNAEYEARRPVLCVINDLEATTNDEPTILMTVGNRFFKIGCIIKKGEEQLVPKAILNELRNKTMIAWENSRNNISKRPTGNKVPKNVRKYNIVIIDEFPKVDGYNQDK